MTPLAGELGRPGPGDPPRDDERDERDEEGTDESDGSPPVDLRHPDMAPSSHHSETYRLATNECQSCRRSPCIARPAGDPGEKRGAGSTVERVVHDGVVHTGTEEGPPVRQSLDRA